MGRRASQTSCQTCRERHLKCDRRTDPCLNCVKSKRECKPPSWFLFRQVSGKAWPKDRQSRHVDSLPAPREGVANRRGRQSPSPSRATAVGQPSEITFVHETPGAFQGSSRLDDTSRPYSISPQIVSEESVLETYESPNSSETGGLSPRHQLNRPVHRPDIAALQESQLRAPLPPDYEQDVRHRTLAANATIDSTALELDVVAAVSSSLSSHADHDVSNLYRAAHPRPSTRQGGVELQSPLPDWTAEDIFTTGTRPDLVQNDDKRDFYGDVQAHAADPPLGCHSEGEAKLLRYFIQEWGPLLDATDESRQFSTSIPYLAWTESPCLLYAILALVACQRSRISDDSTQTSRFYRKRCSQVLVPILLADPDSVHEASIFATYVLLRVYDHLTVNLSERTPESLFSESMALSTKPWNAYSDKASLKRAAFWIHLRQDIHIALMLQCPIHVDHTLYEQTVSVAIQITEEDLAARKVAHDQRGSQQHSPLVGLTEDRNNARIDCAWANRLVGLTCRIMNYCYHLRAQSIEEWTSLLVELESWNLGKPATFQPFFEMAPDPEGGRPFPTLHLQNDWHVLGMLYYHLSVVMLKSHRPGQASRNGDLRNVGYAYREEILHQARLLCGVALSNPISQALLIAGAMLNVTGCFFTDEPSRHGVLGLLDLIKRSTGSPADTIARKLEQFWSRCRSNG